MKSRGVTFLRSKKAKPLLKSKNNGFTLVELIMVVGIMIILSSAAVTGLLGTRTKTSVDGAATTIIADLKQQQIKAMMGESTTGTTSDQGIYLEAGRYTMFSGSSYLVTDPNNIVINLETNIVIQGSLPIQIVFTRRSGQLTGPFSFNLRHSTLGAQRTITLNKFGVITLN